MAGIFRQSWRYPTICPCSNSRPSSPELNPLVNVWAYLHAKKLAISVFDNYEQIVNRCCKAWNFFANDKTAITSITTRQWAKTVND